MIKRFTANFERERGGREGKRQRENKCLFLLQCLCVLRQPKYIS